VRHNGWAALLVLLGAVSAFPQALIHGVVETIEDDQRQPVAEAAVRAFVSDEAVAVAFSGRDGRYALEVPVEAFELRLAKPGYVVARAGGLALPRLQRSCPAAGDCGAVDFLLEKASAVEIWLRDPSGDPFPHALVRLTPAGEDDEKASRWTVTDDRGVKRFYGLPPGRYRLDLRLDTSTNVHGPIYEIDSTEVELRAGENAPVHLSARRAGAETFSFSGTIEGLDFSERHYTVNVRPVDGQPREPLIFNQFTPQLSLPRLPRGEYLIELQTTGAGSKALILGRFRVDENRSGLILRPSEAGTLVGHARFEEGAPDNARIEIQSDEGWTWRSVHVERRFPNFTAEGVPRGSYTLRAGGDDFFLVDSPVLQFGEGSSRAIEITLSASFGRVAGVVRGANERAVRVELAGPKGRLALAPGRNAAFAFEKLVPGDYTLCAAIADEPCAEERLRRFVVEAGDEFEIELGAPQ
jgi:hypothetical protein